MTTTTTEAAAYLETIDILKTALEPTVLSYFPALEGETSLDEFLEAFAIQTVALAGGLADVQMDTLARDFASLRQTMIQGLLTRFPEINDQLESNDAVVLVELLAGVVGVLHLYLDNRAENCASDRATELRSMLSFAHLWGYVPRTAQPSLVVLRFSRTTTENKARLVIPAGTKALASGQSTLTFETLEDLTLLAADDSGTVMAAQQTSVSNAFTATGATSQVLTLSSVGYIEHSAVVSVGSVEWTEVDGFHESGPADYHYRVDVDEDGLASVVFGNGVQGVVPTIGTAISVDWKKGGGSEGRVGSGLITALENSFFVDDNLNSVQLVVTNLKPAYGGRDRETADEIRVNGRRHARANQRSVSAEDFIHYAELVEGVLRAGALTINESASVRENTVVVVVKPEAWATFDADLVEAVENQIRLEYPHTETLDTQVNEAVDLAVDISAVWTEREGYNRADVEAAMEAALEDYFETENRNTGFGQEVHPSVLIEILQSVPGVRDIPLEHFSPEFSVEPGITEIPVLGTMTWLAESDLT